MDSSYNPVNFEPKLYEDWELSGSFAPDLSCEKPSFLITMPPPNVTGALHMGHALFVSIQDTYIRWKRMRGYNALWLPGTDHAGIATQVMVERQVEAEGSSRQKLGREEFVKRIWEWKKEFGGTITEQIRALGSSCDWSRELFTLDEKSSRAVRESFSQLYHQGLIYRGERIVNWSSGLQTAISDLEVEIKPVQGTLFYLKYQLPESKDEFLVVATTRPETIFADVAVAVNPSDERFRRLIGKEVKVPLTNRLVPVIADDYVDIEFGTGALKITPGHDANDWQIGQRHKLQTLSCIDKSGKLNALAGEFSGLVAAHSRKKIAEKLREFALLEKEERHNIELGYCQRTGVVVEPLVSQQWFVKMQSLATPALKAAEGEDAPLRFYPDYWKKTWFEWLNNIQDWCISRQLWWGHRIPAWHCKDCQSITVPRSFKDNDPVTCDSCSSKNIEQDSDVLDTWYSSGLWPLSTLGWPEKTKDLEVFYPTLRFDQPRRGLEAKALMETGSDILFFWVARMVMMCTHFTGGRLPFEDVFLHAMVRDEKGQKMSKTKGNVVDPLDITEKHGADSLRLTLLALSGQGRNVNLDLKRLEGYKAFLNKLWNATRFTLMQLQENTPTISQDPTQKKEELDFVDRWLLEQLSETTKEVNSHLLNYRPDAAFQTIYHFAWYELCDWYLELVKIKKGRLDTLVYALESVFKLLHPMAPFVTDKMASELPNFKGNTLASCQYPATLGQIAKPNDLAWIRHLKLAVEGLRNFRTENKISPKENIPAYAAVTDNEIWHNIKDYTAHLAKVTWLNSQPGALAMAGKVTTEVVTFTLPLDGLVDKDAEKTRLQNEIKKVRSDVDFSRKRLGNEGFVSRAKPELVAKEKEDLAASEAKLVILEEALAKL